MWLTETTLIVCGVACFSWILDRVFGKASILVTLAVIAYLALRETKTNV